MRRLEPPARALLPEIHGNLGTRSADSRVLCLNSCALAGPRWRQKPADLQVTSADGETRTRTGDTTIFSGPTAFVAAWRGAWIARVRRVGRRRLGASRTGTCPARDASGTPTSCAPGGRRRGGRALLGRVRATGPTWCISGG